MSKQPLRVAVVTAAADALGALVAAQGGRRGGLEVVAGALGPAEAFVLVTPADDVPVALREAIELGRAEFRGKPVAFFSPSSGGSAVERLRAVFAELHVVTVGAFDPSSTGAMFEQLEWWGRALRPR